MRYEHLANALDSLTQHRLGLALHAQNEAERAASAAKRAASAELYRARVAETSAALNPPIPPEG